MAYEPVDLDDTVAVVADVVVEVHHRRKCKLLFGGILAAIVILALILTTTWQVVEHRKIVREKNRVIQGLRSELNKSAEGIKELQAKLEETLESLETCKGDANSDIAKLEDCANKIIQLQERIETLNNKTLELAKALNRTKSQVEILQNQTAKKSIEIEGLTKTVEWMESEMANLNGALSNAAEKSRSFQAENSRLRKELKEREEVNKCRSLHIQDGQGNSALHLAVNEGDEYCVIKLVGGGSPVNVKNSKGESPLYRASLINEKRVAVRIIQYLIEKGADVHVKADGSRTFLYNLVDDFTNLTPTQFHDLSSYLISKNLHELFNEPGGAYGGTPFLMAVKTIEVEMRTLTLLYQNGVDFLVYSKVTGNNALYYAMWGRKSTRLFSDLISFGISHRSLAGQRRSLLHIAAGICNVDGLRFYLDKGLYVNAVDDDGNTPLHLVAVWDQRAVMDTVQALVGKGASLGIKNKSGRTPLGELERRSDLGADKNQVVQYLSGRM